jgi:hypothetical protein
MQAGSMHLDCRHIQTGFLHVTEFHHADCGGVRLGHPHPIDLFSSISPATIYPFRFIRQLFVAALHARSGMGLHQNRLESCSYFHYPLPTIPIENSKLIFNL